MFRNQYDSDVSIWSPHGRIYQIEYAMEAVSQGSATVGIKSGTHVVLCAFKRALSSLSAYQRKIEAVDEHVLLSMSGLSSDGRILARSARLECMEHKYEFREPIRGKKLMDSLASKCQRPTMIYGQRAFGVGLLVGVVDPQGQTHLYQLCPSANYYDCHAMAIGARSQPARTYFDKLLSADRNALTNLNLDQLCRSILFIFTNVKDTLPHEEKLNELNCSLGIVGRDEVVRILDEGEDKLKDYLEIVNAEESEAGPVQETTHTGSLPIVSVAAEEEEPREQDEEHGQ
ncbi:hypothetical protein ACOME3_005723 [Neoechinorhynchus agilis]